jgi:hypothetical protein
MTRGNAMRYIPYGYQMTNGKPEINPDEQVVVLKIFESYLEGKSFGIIAKALETDNIQFAQDRTDWNKNRIKRILSDIRYVGVDDYPAIIERDAFEGVRDIRQQKNVTRNKADFRPPCLVICGKCGSRMARVHDIRFKIAEAWKCKNSECTHRVAIADQDLKQMIVVILNKLIKNSNMLYSHKPLDIVNEPEGITETIRLQKEIDNMLGAVDIDKERLKLLIYSLAAEKYKAIDSKPYISEMLRVEFEKSEPLFSFKEMIFSKTVRNIKFESDGELRLVLKNGVEISRSNQNEDIRDYRNERESRKSNTA